MRLTQKPSPFARFANAKANRVPLSLSGLHVGVIALVAVILLSSFAVVYVKDLNRRLFIQYQAQQQTQQQLQTQWGKLLLERSTWSTQSRISKMAKEKLHMVAPSPRDVIMIEE